MKSSYRNLLTAFSIVALISFIGYLSYIKNKQEHTEVAKIKDGALLETESALPSLGGAFKLINTKGEVRTDKNYHGQFHMIYFGYTYCPDICPTGLQSMSHAVQALKAENIVVKPIFITIDPARDTKEQLALYGQNFDASFDMLTGDIKAIDHTKQLFKVYGNKSSDDRGMHDYLLDHSSLIYVMNPRGQFVGYFDHATSSQDMVTKIKAMMQEAH